MAESEASSICVLCCHDTVIWALGECNHPICLLCCARLRVLCDQKDCPVCRMTLKQVMVVSVVKPYQTFPFRHWRFVDRKYDLLFFTEEFFMVYRMIMENRCKLCPHLPFRNFSRLQDHVSKTHQLHFCNICVNNLKLFPSEFKMYTHQKLMAHRKTGDMDDYSYKGHPYCQFCDERYLDIDALHMHLRKHHFWCHFCESDGKQDFYSDIHSLRSHFKKGHYLCEEGECYEDVLLAAFRNEIDLKAHFASSHSKGLSKAEVKKMRHLPVEFYVNSVAEDDVPVNRRKAFPVRGTNGGGHGREAIRSAQIREREERETAVALSASLHEAKAKEKKTSKKPQPVRKKVLCAQKDPEPPPEPPPGFRGPKRRENSEFKSGKKPRSAATDQSGKSTAGKDKGEDKRELVEKDNVVGVTRENWPSLDAQSGITTAETSDSPPPVTPPPGYIKFSRPPKAPPTQSKESSEDAALSSKALPPPEINRPPKAPPTQSKESSEGAKALPLPGYAKIIRPTKIQASKKSSAVSVFSSKSFPPLTEVTATDTPKEVITKNSGGSKVFEDIRKALEYDKAKFKEFQRLSGLFRNGKLVIKNYNTQCRELFGSQWSEIGPLVAKAMPQGEERDDLLALFGRQATGSTTQRTSKKLNKATKKSPNAWTGANGERDMGGERGETAGVSSHAVSEEDYPSLCAAAKLPHPPKGSAYHNVWIHT